MDKINENPGKKPNRHVTRFFILPVKPFVAKILLADPARIFDEIEKKYPVDTINNIEPLNFTRNFYMVGHFAFLQAELQRILKFFSFLFIDQDILNDVQFPFCFKEYKGKAKCSEIHSAFKKKGYSLIKITGIFSKRNSKITDPLLYILDTNWKYYFVNRYLEPPIMDFLSFQIYNRGEKTIQYVLSEYLQLLNLTNSDISPKAIVKYYQRNKDNIYLIRMDKYFDKHSFHKRFSDEDIIFYYRKLLDGEITIREIAKTLNVSVSTIETIFRKNSSVLQKKL